MRYLLAATLAAPILLRTAAPVSAHVSPSLDANNRYLKLTPLTDRVRFAYTIYFGERPGRTLRRAIDTDRDGQLSDAEAKVFSDKLGAEVSRSLEVTLDGATLPVTWSTVDVGFGMPVVDGGSFSVDLIAWLCVSSRQVHHTVSLRDRYELQLAGETNLRVEDSPDVQTTSVRLGEKQADLDFSLQGASARDQLSAEAWEVGYDVFEPTSTGPGCSLDAPSSSKKRWWILAAVVALAIAAMTGLLLRSRAAR